MSTAAARAYDIIKAEIVSGRLAPGQRLKEEALTDLCAVSRTPVREALRRLANEGLAEFGPGQGAQVARMGAGELADLYRLRAQVEGEAAALAAERIDEEGLARLRALADTMEAASARADVAAANGAFHACILEAAGSERLKAMARLVIEAPLALRTIERYAPEELARSMRHHRELIDALAAGDGEWARAVMTSHIRAAYHAIARGMEV